MLNDAEKNLTRQNTLQAMGSTRRVGRRQRTCPMQCQPHRYKEPCTLAPLGKGAPDQAVVPPQLTTSRVLGCSMLEGLACFG